MPLARSAVAAAVLSLPLALTAVPASHAVDMAHIRGTVTTVNGGTVQPLAGIYVEVYLWDGTQTTFVSTDTTEADGTYDMGDLPAGTYRVKFADYVGDTYPEEWHEDAFTAAEGDDVVVAEDATMVVDATLAPGGSIGGTVSDVDSKDPIEGITVEVNRLVGSEWVGLTSVTTSASGNFDVEALPPGSYRLGYLDYANNDYVTEYWDDAPGVELADNVVVLPGQTTDADAELSKNSSVSGTITAPGGAPLPGITIAMYDGGGAQVGSGATGADGQFKLVDVPVGSYRFRFSDPTGTYLPEYYSDVDTLAAAQVVPVATKTAVSGVDADLLLAPVPVENVVAPGIAGTVRVGRTVAVTPGTWAPAAVALTYRWRADGVLVPGATARTLKIASKLRGKRLTASVTATAEGSLPTTVLTSQTAKVAAGSLAPCSARLVKPRSLRPGAKVSVTFSGCAGARRAVSWRLSGKAVPGSRGRASSFTPKRGEAGRVLSVVVSATRTGYEPFSRRLTAGRIGLPLTGRVVVLDPGHQLGNHRFPTKINRLVPAGGFRKRCNTTGTATNSGFPEATLTWDIARRVARGLQALGARVVMTRSSNSARAWGPCVDRRGRSGNDGADLKLSIHADGNLAAGAHGFHVIIPPDRAPWTDDIAAPSRQFALVVRRAMREADFAYSTYIGDRGLDVRSDLGTLNLSDIPTAMIEVGNMRSTVDARVMTTASGRTRYAEALVDAVRTYLR